MFLLLLAFLVWLFATGEYPKWAALIGITSASGGTNA